MTFTITGPTEMTDLWTNSVNQTGLLTFSTESCGNSANPPVQILGCTNFYIYAQPSYNYTDFSSLWQAAMDGRLYTKVKYAGGTASFQLTNTSGPGSKAKK